MNKTSVIITVIIALCLVAPIVSTSFAAPNHGVISIAFDDGMQSQYDYAFPLMQSRGVVGTFYVTTDNIREFSHNTNFMNITELQTLQGNGNEIGSHSKTHPYFPSLSYEQIRDECNISKQILQSNGFTANNFAYPYGGTNDHIDSIVSQYYRSARSAYTPPYVMPLPTSQFNLTAFAGETGDSNALLLLKNMVDQVYSTNGWTIIFFHNILPNVNNASYTISTQDFSSFLDYIISKGVQTLTVNQALDLATSPLTMATNYGTVSPISGQYTTGTTITINAASPAVGPGERYVWLGWTGSGTISYSGTNNPASVTLNSPISETASWRREYYLTVTSPYGTPSGQGWHEDGSITYATLATGNVSGGVGIRYAFTGWSGDASGTGLTSNAITMNGPKTAVANWKTQYYLTVTSANGTAGGDGWFDSGTSAYATVTPLIVAGPAGTQYVFSQWSGDASGTTSPSNAIIMNGPKTAVASWKTQYQVTFGQTGLDSTSTGTVVTVDGSAKTYVDLPFSKWVDSGSSVTYTYSDPVTSSVSGNQFKSSSVTGLTSPITVSGPTTVTANYKTQYYLDVVSSHGTVGGMGWYDSGVTAYATVTPLIVNGSTGVRYVFTNWSGNALGTTSPSDPITMNAPKTATANYRTQYSIIVTSALDSPTPSAWVDVGENFPVIVTSPTEIVPNDHQFVCTGYSVDGGASQAGTDYSFTNVQAAHTIVFNWKEQFWIQVSSSHGTSTASAWVDETNGFTASVTSPSDIVANDHQWVCTGFSVDGGASQAGTDYSFTNVQAAHTIVFNWKEQFWIQVSSSHGTSTASAWVDETNGFTASVTSPSDIVANDHQWVCTGFSVDGGASQAGTDYSFTNVQAAHTIVFNWKEQFWIQVSSSHGTSTASAWVDETNGFTASVTSPSDIVANDHQWVCTGFSVDGGASQAGTDYSFTNVQAAHTIVFNWKEQFWIQVSSSHGTSTASAWVDETNGFTASVTSPSDIVANDHQWVCTGFSVDGGASQAGTDYSFTNVQAAHTIVFNWKEQFWIVFQQTGLPDGVTANVVLNSPKHTLPYSDWFDQGLSLEFAYEDQLPSGFGTQYVLTSTSDLPPLKVGAPINVTGHYAMQYTIEIGLISIPIILGGLAVGIIFVKKRRKKQI